MALGDRNGLTGVGDSTGEPFCIMLMVDERGISAIGAYGLLIFLDDSTSATLSVYGETQNIIKIDEKYLPNIEKNDYLVNGEAYGSLRSILAKAEDEAALGAGAIALGYQSSAIGDNSFASGDNATASGLYSHAEGGNTTASESASHAEGVHSTASGDASHAEGNNATASGSASHAEGLSSIASGPFSHAEGSQSVASAIGTHAEGNFTTAASAYQHAQGKYNIVDSNNKYAHIVGNGTSNTERSNAHTLDWDGNAWFAGAVKVGGSGQDDESAVEVALKTDIPFVTPEMFGAVGDGQTDDTQKIQAAVDSGFAVRMDKKYLITSPIKIKRDHVVIDGLEAEIYVKDNFAFKAEARHFNIKIGKCQSVDGSGSVTTTPIFPAGSGFFLFDANFDVTQSDTYWYSYGYGNVFIGEAKFLQYGIRLCPEATDKMCGIEYTVFEGNDLWCEKCIDLSPMTNNDTLPAWTNQNTFNNFRLRGNFGIYIEPNVRWTAEGNTFYRCGLEGFNANGAGIYCNGVSNSFIDLRNAEVEALGENAKWVNLGPNAHLNKFEFYTLDVSKCYVDPSEDNRNEFNCILTDGEVVYHSQQNCNYNYKGYFVAPDCEYTWIQANGAVGLENYIATPVTIYSKPCESNVFIYLSPVYGHRGITEFTVIVPNDQTWSTFIMGTDGNILHTFATPGTYYLKYNSYTGEWDVHEHVKKITVDTAINTESGNPVSNAAITQYVNQNNNNLYQHFEQSIATIPYIGNNLYTGTRDFTGDKWINRQYWYDGNEYYNGFKVLYTPSQWTGLSQRVWVTGGTVVTFSLYAKCTEGATIKMYTSTGSSDDANVDGNAHGRIIEGVNTEWKRFTVTFTAWSDGYISPRFENETGGATIYVCGIKLEYGNKETPWIDSAEDRSGEKRLPVATAEDAGKFLRVQPDGTWGMEALTDVSEVGA